MFKIIKKYKNTKWIQRIQQTFVQKSRIKYWAWYHNLDFLVDHCMYINQYNWYYCIFFLSLETSTRNTESFMCTHWSRGQKQIRQRHSK